MSFIKKHVEWAEFNAEVDPSNPNLKQVLLTNIHKDVSQGDLRRTLRFHGLDTNLVSVSLNKGKGLATLTFREYTDALFCVAKSQLKEISLLGRSLGFERFCDA